MNATALTGLDHTLVTLVAAMARGVERRGDGSRRYACTHSFVLEHGRLWRYDQHDRLQTFGEARQCYMNAAKLAIHGDWLTYCEGFAMVEGLSLPFPHAWVVGLDGEVVDTTWRNPGARAYLGVPFRTDYLLRAVVARETWGPLIDRHEDDFPLLSGEHSEAEAVQRWPR